MYVNKNGKNIWGIKILISVMFINIYTIHKTRKLHSINKKEFKMTNYYQKNRCKFYKLANLKLRNTLW